MNIQLSAPINGDDIVNQLFPNLPIFIAHIVATVVLLMVLWRLVYRPFRILLHERHIAIKAKLDDAAEKQALANQDRGNANQVLNAAKTEADGIVSEAKLKAYDERKSIIDGAYEEAMRIRNQSKHDFVRQKQEAEKQIKQEIETISLTVAQKILKQEINAGKHQSLIDDFIKDIEKQ